MDQSPNCSAYTDAISILVQGKATVPGVSGCSVQVPHTFSCQKKNFEAPDEATSSVMTQSAVDMLNEMGCPTDNIEMKYITNLIGARQTEYSADKLSELGMASNCYKEGNDPNHATHMIESRCTNQYEMTDASGTRVRDTNKVFISRLSTCDVSDEAMPQLMEDGRKVAMHHALANGLTMDKSSDMSCQFAILPQM